MLVHSKGKRCIFRVRKPGRYHLNKRSKANMISIKIMSHLIACSKESESLLCCSLPECRTGIEPWGDIGQNPAERHATKFLARHLQKHQGHEGQGKTEELFQTAGDMLFESSNVASLRRPALATLFKIPNPPLPHSLCLPPCITSQLLTSSRFSYFSTLFVSFTGTKSPRRERLLSCLARRCVATA